MPDDSSGSGRGRRRRRRGRGANGDKSGDKGGDKSARPDQSPGTASQGAGSQGDGKPARRRRGPPRGGAGESQPGKREGDARRGKREGDARPSKRDPSPPPPPRAEAPGRDKPATTPPLTQVDLGWDDEPVDLPPEQEPSRKRGAQIADSIVWGDDSSAAEPSGPLPPKLPAAVAKGDLDPSTEGLGDDAVDLGVAVATIAGIKFATAGKIYEFDAGDGSYKVGDRVSVEGDRGTRSGFIAVAPARRSVTRALKKIVRKLGPERSQGTDEERERAALATAKQCARDLGLPIKIFRVESRGGRGKISVYFSSEKKIEQRQLARDLADQLGGRVELRQTGVRDEAKIIGGIGSCGMELCCTTWLPAFVPVSIKNAKDQGLVLNPTKVSGQCGRLKCCLVYEQATYAEARKGLPKLGKRVVTGEGEGRVVEVDVLKRRIRVNHGDGRFDVYDADDVTPMFPPQKQASGEGKSGKGAKRAPPASVPSRTSEKPSDETPEE